MTMSLKVIALISGGKDSLFSILHCLANGHTVVALANLRPPVPSDGNDFEEDLNSYMYQTVGYTVIPLYEEALGIPLYRQEISGSAVNTNRDYAVLPEGGDETESLIPLLKKVKEAHPDANAVSTGAILSTYQRTRVESIALRLGLTPLSYLWQYPHLPPYSQSGLLHDMAAVGQIANIIKVASGGLDQTFLWEDVASARTILRMSKAMARFGENGDGAVLGEGGEFETLAIDGPGVLWKKRIDIEPDEVVIGEGGNAIFKGKSAKAIEKHTGKDDGLKNLRIPGLWDDEFKKVLDTLSETLPSTAQGQPTEQKSTLKELLATAVSSTLTTVTISNLTASQPGDPSSQLRDILQKLTDNLTAHGLTPQHISHTTLLLRRISDFATINPIYGSIFTNPNPPSRVTVACGDAMPSGVDVMLSTIVSSTIPVQSGLIRRKGLHVQSRSYWAPANIGPYSQAISVSLPILSSSEPTPDPAEVVYVAGQIPLIPASMEVYQEAGFSGQAVLALQHLWRIGRTVGVRWWTASVAYISDCERGEAEERVRIAQEAWKAIHEHYLTSSSSSADDGEEDDEDIDPWDLQNRVGFGQQQIDDKTYRSPIPDPEAVVSKGKKLVSPCFVVQVDQLPRNVDIEWHSTGLAKCTISTPSQQTIEVESANTMFFNLEIGEQDDVEGVKGTLRQMMNGDCEHVTLYAVPELGSAWCTVVQGLQWVPCKRVWGAGGRVLSGILVGRATAKTEYAF